MTVGIKTFNEDLEKGKEKENDVLAIIQKKYPSAKNIVGYKKEYDIEIPEKGMTVEVKYDIKSPDTGNIFIEVECDERPSGLSTTTADYWVIRSGKYLFWITPQNLSLMIIADNLNQIFCANDGHSVRAYLIPTVNFLKNKEVFKTIIN